MPNIRFQRANYLVRNLEESLRFYRDVLGFHVDFVLPPNEESYSYSVFDIPKDAVMRFCVLSTKTQERVMALTEVNGIELKPIPHPRRSAIVIECHEFDATIAAAKQLHLTVYDEEVLITKDGRVGREIGIVDKDDNLIVLYKF